MPRGCGLMLPPRHLHVLLCILVSFGDAGKPLVGKDFPAKKIPFNSVRNEEEHNVANSSHPVYRNISSNHDDKHKGLGSSISDPERGPQPLGRSLDHSRGKMPSPSPEGPPPLEKNSPHHLLQQSPNHFTWRSGNITDHARRWHGTKGRESSNPVQWTMAVKYAVRVQGHSPSLPKPTFLDNSPHISPQENIQFPRYATLPDVAEVDNFLEKNISKRETLPRNMKEKPQENSSMSDQALRNFSILKCSLSTSLDKAKLQGDSFTTNLRSVTSSTLSLMERLLGFGKLLNFLWKTGNHKRQHFSHAIHEDDDSLSEDKHTLKLLTESTIFKNKLQPIVGSDNGTAESPRPRSFMMVETSPTFARKKRDMAGFQSREKENDEAVWQNKEQFEEGPPTRKSWKTIRNPRLMEIPLVRHGRERLSIIRKKATRNQTNSYRTLSPTKYYNVFIKNFPQIFMNYHSKFPSQHVHLPTKRIRQPSSIGGDILGSISDSKKEPGKLHKSHGQHTSRLSGRGENQQRHARSRNRAKRKATTREVWALAGEDTLLPCDLGVRTPRDAIQMVMWLKEGSHTPLFSVDFREQERGRPQIWRDNSSSTARRARLFTGEDFPFPEGNQDLHVVGGEETSREVGLEAEMEDVGGLLVQKVEVGDATVYRCRVDFLLTATRNARVNLTVVVPPTSVGVAWWLDEERGSNSGGEVGPFKEGDSPTLVCYTRDAWPPPQVVWLEEDIQVDSSFTIDPKNEAVVNSMTILNVTRANHLRRYTCNASNSNLTRPISATVLLQMSLDVLGVKMDNVGALSAGVRAEVQCTVWGSSPPPTVIWKLGEKELPSPNTWISDDRNRSVSMVSFTPQARDDGARLECSAFNPVMSPGNVNSPPPRHNDSQILDINYVPQVSVSLGKSLDAENIKEGDDLYFECSAVAKPPPHRVTWSHNGEHLLEGPGVLVSEMTLVLQKVSRSNAGTYTCHVTNAEGTSSSPPLTLDVKYAPVCASPVASQHSVAKYENAIISCNVLANPPYVQFSWAFNNTAEAVSVPEDRYVVQNTESVVNYTPVTELDYGTLLCWASNEIGVQKYPCLFQIVAAGKPEPPHNCRAFDVTISSLQVSCLPGDDGGLGQTFILQVLEVSGDQKPVIEVTKETASFSVANLRPATTYRLLVTATNAKGESHPAELRAYTVALNHPQHETPAEPTRGRETGSEVAVGVLVGAVLTCLPVAIVVVVMGVRACLKMRAARYRHRHGEENEKDATENEGMNTGRPLLTGTPGSGGGLSTESGSDITTITGGVGLAPSASLPHNTHSPDHSESQLTQAHPTESGGRVYVGSRAYVPEPTLDGGQQICSTSNSKVRRGPYNSSDEKYDGDNDMLEITLPPPAAYDQGYHSPSPRYQLGSVQGYSSGTPQTYQSRMHQEYPPQDQVSLRPKQSFQQGYEGYQSLHRNGQLISSGYPVIPAVGQPSVHYISSGATLGQDYHSSPKAEPCSGIGKVTGSSSFVGLPVTSKDSKPESSRALPHEIDSTMPALYNPLTMFTTSGSGSSSPSYHQHSERPVFATGSLKRHKPQGQNIVRLKDNNLQRNRSASLSSVRGKRESSV